MTDTVDLKPIHVLLIEDMSNGYWSAQCLEYDIATQAKSYAGILEEVERVLDCHRRYAEKHGLKPFEGLKSAPAVFWKMYYNSRYSRSTQPVNAPAEAPTKARILQPACIS